MKLFQTSGRVSQKGLPSSADGVAPALPALLTRMPTGAEVGGGLGDHVLDGCVVGDVALQGDRLAAGAP
jgi:hypothetical protein